MANRGGKRAKPKTKTKAPGRKASTGEGSATTAKSRPRVRRSPEQARATILAAARKVFAELGPTPLVSKMWPPRPGVSHGLITHYFGTFDGLVEATMAEHIRVVRQRLLDQLASGDTTLSAGRFIDAFFEVIEDPLYGRLAAWAILSGRFQSKDFFPRKEQGPARVVDAVHLWLASRGMEGVDREDIELALILVLTAGLGYGMGKSVLWASLGRRASKARDARFRALLAEFVDSRLRAHDADVGDASQEQG